MIPYPEPDEIPSLLHGQRSEVQADAHRSQLANPLELKGRMRSVGLE
jgi:hypothetical protein